SDSDSISSDQTALGTAQQNVILAQANLNAAQAAMSEAQSQLSQAQNPTPATALIEAQAQVQLLQSEIAQETVRAPFAGVVVSVPAVTGQQVGTGTALATLNTATLVVNAPLSQQDLALVHAGEQASASIAGAPGALPLTVQAVAPSGNSGSLTFGVTFAVAATSQPAWLFAGEAAVVDVTTKKYSPAVLIPSEAIVSINGAPQVFEIHSNHTVSLIDVTPGVSDGTTTMVTGLTAGTKVVAVGQTYLANGGRVKISSSIPVASAVVGTAVAGLAIATTLPSPVSAAKKGGKGGKGGGGGSAGGLGGLGGGGLGGLGGGKKG
ncbi:MAG: HlyD family efflux transporter periplasmic adaptor subunit, partial [Actinobacteria bacterium]|nr:HlyD family efflux transporter periplasmic adaptor subunit [Actinomycetota bacterium]